MTPWQPPRRHASLLGSFEFPLHIEGLELLVRASAGVALAPEHGADSDTLLKNVDIALYHAKLERDRISIYSPEFDINTLERLQLLADLRTAIDVGELYVVYQPQFHLSDRSLVGVEALVRWRHPRRGEVLAEEFIGLAESSGLIVPLTAYVLDEALGQFAKWRAAGNELRMAVNLSARLLSDLALPAQISAALERHNVPAVWPGAGGYGDRHPGRRREGRRRCAGFARARRGHRDRRLRHGQRVAQLPQATRG